MRSLKFLPLFMSIVSFQPSQATDSTAQREVKLFEDLAAKIKESTTETEFEQKFDSAKESSKSSLIGGSESSSKESLSFWRQTKKFIFSWLSSFKSSPSHHDDQVWAQEWDRLVKHVLTINAQQVKYLLTQMKIREEELSKGEEHYQELAQTFGKTPKFIKQEDLKLINKLISTGLGNKLIALAKKSMNYLEDQDNAQQEFDAREYTRLLSDFYIAIEAEGIDEDHFDEELFKQGYDYKNVLTKIEKLKRRPENLPYLKDLVKRLYVKLDGGELSELSRDTLDSLGIRVGQPQRRSSWLSSRNVGTGLLFLLASSSIITTAAAARPPLLNSFCSTSEFTYGTCETSFSAPLGFDTEIASIKSNSFFQDIITSKILQLNRASSIVDTTSNLGGMYNQFYGELITSRTGSFSGGNFTSNSYFVFPPHLGMQDAPFSSTQYHRIAFNMSGTNDASRQNINSYVRTGPMEPSYYGQIPDSERMILAITDANQTWPFIYGVVVDRPFGGTPTIVREGILTSTVAAVYPDALTSTVVNNVNPNAPLPVESVDNFVGRLHGGLVAGSDCSNPRSVSQYFDDIGFSSSPLFLDSKTCLGKPGVSPLACDFEFSQSPGFITSLYIHTNQMNAVTALFRNLLLGGNYTEGTYRSGSGNVLETRMDYVWNPSLSTATQTNSTIAMPMSTLIGSLPLNQVEKFVIFNPYNTTAGYVIRATQNSSGTAFSYYVTPGPEICIPAAPTISPVSGPSPIITPVPVEGPSPISAPNDPNVGGPTDQPSGLSKEAIIGISVPVGAVVLGGGILGLICGLKKSKENKNSKFDDLEGGNSQGRSTSSTLLSPVGKITKESFNASEKGILSGITVVGKLFERQYQLLFKMTKKKFDEITVAADLKIDFEAEKKALAPGKEPKMDLILGGGNFGQVRVAQDVETNEPVAVKIVPGNVKVQESLREGNMQHRLRDVPYILPLLDRLHYKPGKDGEASAKLLKMAFGNTDGQGEDLLLQFTPLASFGDGDALSYRLSLLKDELLKEKIVTYVSYCFVTGLMGMHHQGVSHLDFKPGNLLLSWKGKVWVGDMGCAVQKKMLRGGLGDFRYFSWERLESLRQPIAYSGHAADAFAAGLSILELMFNNHPFQKLFDQRDQGVSIPNDMIKNWTSVDYREGLDEALLGQKGKLFDVVRGLTAIKPEERWSMERAHKELQKLLPQEKPEILFNQLLQALLGPQGSPEVEQRQGNSLIYQSASSGTKKAQETEDKKNLFYQAIPKKEEMEKVYGQDLEVYKDMQLVYQNVDLDDPEEKSTYVDIPDEELNGSLPQRGSKNPSFTPSEWVYQDPKSVPRASSSNPGVSAYQNIRNGGLTDDRF